MTTNIYIKLIYLNFKNHNKNTTIISTSYFYFTYCHVIFILCEGNIQLYFHYYAKNERKNIKTRFTEHDSHRESLHTYSAMISYNKTDEPDFYKKR